VKAVEINCEICNKELVAIVYSFHEWRHLLVGASHPMMVYTNHKSFEYCMFYRVLKYCQASWSMSLSCFYFIITYRPCHHQRLSDGLLRQLLLKPKEGKGAYNQ